MPPNAKAPLRNIILVAVLATCAHLPGLEGEFLYDDHRFIVDNEAVHHLSPASIATYFLDPATVATEGAEGIYRPLRTLDFAVDWGVSGGRAWFFHLRNVIYHALGSVLVLLLLLRLVSSRAALCGAALFALHPVHVESVAWISSRGDLLLLVFFVGALLLHLKERTGLALLLLAGALLSKETAVMFVAAALLVDFLRRAEIRWRAYAGYAATTIGFMVLWLVLTRRGGEDALGQSSLWLGGSRLGATVTAAKGLVYDAKLLLLPVELVNDYHVPARIAVDGGALISFGLLAVIGVLALFSSRTSRFAFLWCLVTLLPVLGVVLPMIIPTAERFLLLPAVGFSLWAGGLLARTKLRYIVFACLLALTVWRTRDWHDEGTLWLSTLEVTDTPRALEWKSRRSFAKAWSTGDRLHVQDVVDAAADYRSLHERDIQFGGEGALVMPVRTSWPMFIRAQIADGDYAAARDGAHRLATVHGVPEGHYLASFALEAQGEYELAAGAALMARKAGYRAGNSERRVEALLRMARDRR